jgi:hypothetical protein
MVLVRRKSEQSNRTIRRTADMVARWTKSDYPTDAQIHAILAKFILLSYLIRVDAAAGNIDSIRAPKT